MSSWKIQVNGSGGQVADIELMDKMGPYNEWKSVSEEAFIPEKGTFTNQTKTVVPTVQPTWILNNLDIDEVEVGDVGKGEIKDNDGTFPIGEITWKVISRL